MFLLNALELHYWSTSNRRLLMGSLGHVLLWPLSPNFTFRFWHWITNALFSHSKILRIRCCERGFVSLFWTCRFMPLSHIIRSWFKYFPNLFLFTSPSSARLFFPSHWALRSNTYHVHKGKERYNSDKLNPIYDFISLPYLSVPAARLLGGVT